MYSETSPVVSSEPRAKGRICYGAAGGRAGVSTTPPLKLAVEALGGGRYALRLRGTDLYVQACTPTIHTGLCE